MGSAISHISAMDNWRHAQNQNLAQQQMMNAQASNSLRGQMPGMGLWGPRERTSPIPRVIKCEGCGARHRETVACEYCGDGK